MKTYFSKFYKSQNFMWVIDEFGDVYLHNLNGPFCINCKMDIVFPKKAYYMDFDSEAGVEFEALSEAYEGPVFCSACERQYKLGLPLGKLKRKVIHDYVLKKRANISVESLDELPADVKVRDQDEKYFLATKIGEQNGKRVGVVYFGEKNKEQNKKDYSQIFIDLDGDQVRFDKSNKPPKDIIAKMKIEFPDVIHEEIYEKINKAKRGSKPKERRKT